MGMMGWLSVAGMVQRCQERLPGRLPLLQGELPVMARFAGQPSIRQISVTLLEKSGLRVFFPAALQEIASLKRQFAELLSDIGFIKEGLRARVIERLGSKGSDGVLEATGPEVTHI